MTRRFEQTRAGSSSPTDFLACSYCGLFVLSGPRRALAGRGEAATGKGDGQWPEIQDCQEGGEGV